MADAEVSIAVPDEFVQHGRRGRFRDPVVDGDFRRWRVEQTVSTARVITGWSAMFWASLPLLYGLFLADVPRVVTIGAWGIAAPGLALFTLGTYTPMNRWLSVAAAVGGAVLGLTAIWMTSAMYGPYSGTVALIAVVIALQAMLIRISTEAAAMVTVVLFGVPIALQVAGTIRGEVPLFDAFLIIFVLVANAPVAVLAIAKIESGMRQQFAAQRTILRQQTQLQASQRLLRRYAPSAVAGRIESGDAATVGQPQRLRVTAMSSDVAGFTALADQIDPESLSQIINEYMATMSDVVESRGGVVTEFAGDGLMAIFGAPETLEPDEQVRRALSAANAMHSRLGELNETWFRLGIEQPLRVRIGVNTGMLSVGTFGSDGRATYTAIGLQMNVAARIQAQCEPGGILLSSASWHLVNDTVECDPLGEVTVKGVHFPISIYAPRKPAAEISSQA